MSRDNNRGTWITLGVVIVIIGILMHLMSCGLGKAVDMQKAHRAHPGRSGYSMIELLAVMGIIALILACGMVGWNAIGKQGKFNAAVAKLEAGISLGRQYALAKNEPVLVVFVEPYSFSILNPGVTQWRCGWAILGARTRSWVKPFVDLADSGAVFDLASLMPDRRNVNGLFDGGAWLAYTNIPQPWVCGVTNPPTLCLPAIVIKTDGMLHLRGNDSCLKPKAVLLAPGAYTGNPISGWGSTVTSTRRVAVSVNAAGSTMIDTISE